MRRLILISATMVSALSLRAQIDVHSHSITQNYLNAVKAERIEMDEGFPIPGWSADAHLKFMDEAGIHGRVSLSGGYKSTGIGKTIQEGYTMIRWILLVAIVAMVLPFCMQGRKKKTLAA